MGRMWGYSAVKSWVNFSKDEVAVKMCGKFHGFPQSADHFVSGWQYIFDPPNRRVGTPQAEGPARGQ